MIVSRVSVSGSGLRVKLASALLGGDRASGGAGLGFQQASISRRGPGVAALALHVGKELRFPPCLRCRQLSFWDLYLTWIPAASLSSSSSSSHNCLSQTSQGRAAYEAVSPSVPVRST